MRIYRINLKNYKRIYNGTGQTEMQILFDKDKSIIKIQGPNGCGKSTLLSLLTPLPDPPSEIIPDKDGYKEIVITDDNAPPYTIFYRYSKGKTDGASVTRLEPTGFRTELNPSGNVTTAKELVYSLFGLDSNFETLTLMSGYGRKSLATMRPSERKGFISSILNNLDVYTGIYKSLSKRSSIFKALLNSVTNKMNSIGSPEELKQEADKLEEEIATLISEKESLLIESKRLALTEEEAKANEERRNQLLVYKAFLDSLEDGISSEANEYNSALLYWKDKVKITDSIDDHYALLEEINKRIALRDKTLSEIDETRTKLELYASKKRIIELDSEYQKLRTYNSAEMRREAEEAATWMSLVSKKYPDIDAWAFEVSVSELRTVLQQWVSIKNRLSPAISTQYRQSLAAQTVIDSNGNYDIDQVFAAKHEYYQLLIEGKGSPEHLIGVLDDIDMSLMNVAEIKIRSAIDTQVNDLFNRVQGLIKALEQFKIIPNHPIEEFDLDSAMDWYDACIIYTKKHETVTKYKMYTTASYETEYQDKCHAIDVLQEKMEETERRITELNRLLAEDDLQNTEKKLKEIQFLIHHLKIYKGYNERRTVVKRNIADLEATIVDDQEATILKSTINEYNVRISELQSKLYRYRYSLDTLQEYITELAKYKQNYQYTEVLKKYCSPSTGIQLVFVELYMNKIIEMANRLLSHLFKGEFTLQPFVINEGEFRIPVLGNGLLIDDVSSMSSSQIAMINMCISFAILAHSSSKYRILRLDELDGPLDTNNRNHYTEILHEVMDILGSQQCFIVSHNMELNDVDFQVIKLGGD